MNRLVVLTVRTLRAWLGLEGQSFGHCGLHQPLCEWGVITEKREEIVWQLMELATMAQEAILGTHAGP